MFCMAMCIACGAFLFWAIQNEDVVSREAVLPSIGRKSTHQTDFLIVGERSNQEGHKQVDKDQLRQRKNQRHRDACRSNSA